MFYIAQFNRIAMKAKNHNYSARGCALRLMQIMKMLKIWPKNMANTINIGIK